MASALALASCSGPGASPSPGIAGPIDTRTSDPPGIVRGPLEILVGVILLGFVTALDTIAWSRFARARDQI